VVLVQVQVQEIKRRCQEGGGEDSASMSGWEVVGVNCRGPPGTAWPLYLLDVQCVLPLIACRWHSNRQQQKGLSGLKAGTSSGGQHRQAGRQVGTYNRWHEGLLGCCVMNPGCCTHLGGHLGGAGGCWWVRGRTAAGYCDIWCTCEHHGSGQSTRLPAVYTTGQAGGVQDPQGVQCQVTQVRR
jgi:hypothetical protein